MPVRPAALDGFAKEVRRLAGAGEPPLYPAYKALLEAAYPTNFTVDSLLRSPGAGFPDFTVTRALRLVNWVEVKHPGVSVDPLPGPDAERFDRYRHALPHIVLTNGWCWRLFEEGRETDRAEVPRDWLVGGSALSAAQQEQLQRFLAHVTTLTPSAATTYDEAVRLLATSAQLVEAAVMDAAGAGFPQPLDEARQSFVELLRTNPADPAEITNERFADVLAQAVVFGFLLARVEAGGDISPASAPDALDTNEHPFLKTTLYAVVAPDPNLEEALQGVLRTACDAVNAAAPKLAGPAGNWEHVPYVYEPFFALYKPEDRFELGVFYTPEVITRFQVQETQAKLRDELGLAGLTDPAVRFLDPGCGTGTYLLALAEEARLEAQQLGLPVATTLQELFRDRVVGFEVSPGPASVAQARLTAWLRNHGVTLGARFPVFVVNTLAPPAAGAPGGGGAPPSLWAQNISHEQQAGDDVKRSQPVLVVFGNPPWGDRPRETFRTGPTNADNIISEWAQGASGAVINLYDLYVAFWRFAVGMLLERPGTQPPRGIVCYITNRSWLRGKAYGGMRSWLRAHGVTAELTDLGGDIRAGAAADDEPVFSILAGSAIGTLCFDGANAGRISYRRVRGTRADKFDALRTRGLPAWEQVAGTGTDPFGPIDWGALAHGEPITRFFAHNWPGVKTHRDELIIDPSREALLARIHHWNGLTGEERSEAFGNTATRSAPDPYTVDEAQIVKHRYRPLDDRYLYGDRRFIDRPGTISRYYSDGQETSALITMDTRTSAGPVVIATPTLPGYNSFRGSYETHVFPLSAAAGEGQLDVGGAAVLTPAAQRWADSHGAGADDVAAYILALGAAPSYAETFGEALENDIVRFPAVTDPQLFQEAVAVGGRLLAAWSLECAPLGSWHQVSPGVQLGGARVEGDAILFENGDRLDGIHVGTWDFSVSGYPVMQRYLETRAHLALTGELSEDIRRVAGAISALLQEQPTCDSLLERAIAASSTAL